MRKNLPVTDHEVVMTEGQVIISETDLKGIITEVDQDFIDISGFSRDELVGKNHNLIRHPDMPASAFQWLWDTIRAGEPWTGIVKNRCKDGSFYWVHANVTPIFDQGEITGYVSVRTKPSREDIDAAAALYEAINAGKVVLGKQTLLQKMNILSRMKVWHKIAATLALTALLLSGSWWIALQGLSNSHDSFLMANNDRAVALAAADINTEILAIMVDLKKTLTSSNPDYDHNHQFMVNKLQAIDKSIAIITSADLGEQERTAANAALAATHAYINGTIKPLLAATQANQRGEYDDGVFADTVIHMDNAAFSRLQKASHAFRQIQADTSRQESQAGTAQYQQIKQLSMLSVGISILLALIFSTLLIRNFSRRLRYTTKNLAHIAEGNYFDWVIVDNNDEIGSMLAGLKSMQIRQGYTVQKIEEQAREALQIKVALDQVSLPVQIADADYRLFYMNDAARKMFGDYRDAFGQVINDFNPDKLLGSCIDIFHKDPSHQRRMLDGLTGSMTTGDLVFGGDLVVQVTATPVLDESGTRIATVAEWRDRSAEVIAEKEVGEIVTAAQHGDLSQRISLEGKQGFFIDLSNALNALTATVEQAVDDTVAGLSALEAGDLTYRINTDYKGKFNDIKQSANNTAAKLAEVIGNVNASAEEVSIGAGEISEGNNTLSSRTQEQAAALEETAASIEEITGTVQQTADNSRQANQLAADARDQAENGGQVADQAVQAMAEINASSRKIADIIGVIDEIAFQTNLLALNAAVEAARAGEQGRGFAVVAGEVRTLAQRSAEAAKEIKTLINSSVESVDAGTKLVDESGTALNDIRGAVAKVSDIIAEIAAASVEQTSGIDQINKAIAQLDAGTQQNTAMVEESAAASQRLNDQAAELRQQVSIFRLD